MPMIGTSVYSIVYIQIIVNVGVIESIFSVQTGRTLRLQREGQAEAPRSEVVGVRRVREGAGDGVQRRTGLAALEVVAARAAPRQQRLHERGRFWTLHPARFWTAAHETGAYCE